MKKLIPFALIAGLIFAYIKIDAFKNFINGLIGIKKPITPQFSQPTTETTQTQTNNLNSL